MNTQIMTNLAICTVPFKEPLTLKIMCYARDLYKVKWLDFSFTIKRLNYPSLNSYYTFTPPPIVDDLDTQLMGCVGGNRFGYTVHWLGIL